jgi:hypothetical protein
MSIRRECTVAVRFDGLETKLNSPNTFFIEQEVVKVIYAVSEIFNVLCYSKKQFNIHGSVDRSMIQ